MLGGIAMSSDEEAVDNAQALVLQPNNASLLSLGAGTLAGFAFASGRV